MTLLALEAEANANDFSPNYLVAIGMQWLLSVYCVGRQDEILNAFVAQSLPARITR
ncbi:hypothetical protein [Leptolyngbya sp. 'hensonii']|uniref:hypothetical protein n=1 Tax=Leptolyngbya sp. 'hensonii' TaxID=1922337 RepID=UPI000ADE51A3|nr:hypothetical protein [Leptolyngbya sp. 'hensonii']